MEGTEIQPTALFLWEIARTLSTTCPAASRHYMSTLNRHISSSLIHQSFVKFHQFCKYCGSLWNHSNHKIRIHPIPSPNSHIKKLLKWEKEQPWKLNNQQKKKLKKYRESRNKIIYTCSVCKRTTSLAGLKKYHAREQEMLINTPVPKIKPKKGDLNAGLFIRTTTEKKKSIKLENDVPLQASSTPGLTDSSKPSNAPQTIQKMNKTPEIMKKNVTLQITSSSKKRKKGLLAQMLNQEQEAKRQKKTLSSFLTSLM